MCQCCCSLHGCLSSRGELLRRFLGWWEGTVAQWEVAVVCLQRTHSELRNGTGCLVPLPFCCVLLLWGMLCVGIGCSLIPIPWAHWSAAETKRCFGQTGDAQMRKSTPQLEQKLGEKTYWPTALILNFIIWSCSSLKARRQKKKTQTLNPSSLVPAQLICSAICPST